MRLATFQSELGQQKLHDMTDQNTKDLCEILLWNADNNIRLFRLSSEVSPARCDLSLDVTRSTLD